MEKFVVSVIIPTHNNGDLIEKAIMSLVNQDFTLPFEILVVQDACEDNTEEVVASLMKKYSFIHTLGVNNRSAIKTRKDGLGASLGKYIMWLDGDDYVSKDMISTLYNKLIENDADLVNSNVYYVKKNGIQKEFFATNKVYNKEKAFKAFLADTTYRGFLPTKIFKRDLLIKCGFMGLPEGHYAYEDGIVNAKYLLLCNKVVSINKAMYYYNKVNENSITTRSSTRIQDQINSKAYIRYHLERYGDVKLLKAFRKSYLRARLNLMADFAMNHYEDDKNKKMIKSAAKRDFKTIYGKNPLEIEGKSYENFIKSFDKYTKI